MLRVTLRYLRKIFIWPVEALLFYSFAGVAWIMPPQISSAVMALVIGIIGPLTPYHHRSLFNIGFAMPEMSLAERRRIARGMWFNLGRVVGEYIHIRRLMKSKRITIEGLEHLALLDDKGGFLIGAHIGNWELAVTPAINAGLPVNGVYRRINNALIEPMMNRRMRIFKNIYEKGVHGARGLAASVKKKEIYAMLIDQKLREGEMLDFFGHKASTSVAHLRFVQKHDLPVLMIRVIRTKGCWFKVEITPLDLSGFDKRDKDYISKTGTYINGIIEGWIRDHPEQWLWPHRRWPESKGEVYTPPQN
jgi:KDO2-lipid IV(A) lauroyltransferase